MLSIFITTWSNSSITPTSQRLGIRAWVVAGAVGLLLFLVALFGQQAWSVNMAGIFINRARVSGETSSLPSVLPALESQTNAGSSPSLWRTYGAAATRHPSERAFRLLKLARDRGRLDRIGQLWFGEVASATGHWPEARQAYASVNAANLLLARGEAAQKVHHNETAANWYRLASTSVLAAAQRQTGNPANGGGPGPGGQDDPGGQNGFLRSPGETAVLLLRIGQGFSQLGLRSEAVDTLQQALDQTKVHPPGIRDCQSIRFALGQALLAGRRSNGAASAKVGGRVRVLVEEALALDDSGWARLQAGRTLAQLGDRRQAIESLRRAIELDPLLADAYLLLGNLYRKDGVLSLARDLYQEGSQHIPSNRQLFDAWATTTYQTSSIEEAFPLLLRAVDAHTSEPYVYAYLGDCYLAKGLITEARATYQQGLLLAPGAQPLLDRKALLPKPSGMTP